MKRTRLRILLTMALAVGLLAAGCGGDTATNDSGSQTPVPEPSSPDEKGTPEPTGETGTVPPAVEVPEPGANPLMNPASPDMNATAPSLYRVLFDTTRGEFTLEVQRDWAPIGADRFYNLVREGFYDGARFFRVIDGFVAQFGISGDPELSEIWREATIADDPPNEKNTRGRITFANAGANTRTVQLFINLGDNLNLDLQGFPPFGEVVEGMGVVQSLYSEYGEGPPRGRGPNQGRIQSEGNRYLERDFPQLDYVKTARIVGER